MRKTISRRRQRGAVIITVALFLLFLLGFMGLAIDFGRLFVVKTELQTAVDSCALAAAQELDGASDALTRATSAGLTAGNLNKVHFQSGAAGLVGGTDILFSDTLNGSYSASFDFKTAKYAKCEHVQSGLLPWLLQAMSAFPGNSSYASSNSVMALGVATRAPSQTNCVMPIGICKKGTGALFGYSRGQWIESVVNSSQDSIEDSGAFKWLDYTGSGGGTHEIKDLLSGDGALCNLPGTAASVSEPSKNGKSNGAVEAWNTRFGLYAGSYSQADNPSDQTGYAWYAQNASGVKPGRYDDASSAGFLAKRTAHAPYQGGNLNPDTLGLNVLPANGNGNGNGNGNNSPKLADYTKGGDRRIMTVGVVDCSVSPLKLEGFACALALHPMEKNASGKTAKMWLEFIGNAADTTGNPCSTGGLAGGSTGGPLVPVLVQ